MNQIFITALTKITANNISSNTFYTIFRINVQKTKGLIKR